MKKDYKKSRPIAIVIGQLNIQARNAYGPYANRQNKKRTTGTHDTRRADLKLRKF